VPLAPVTSHESRVTSHGPWRRAFAAPQKKNPAALAYRGAFHHLLGSSDRLPATATTTATTAAAAAWAARTTATAAATATATLTFLRFVDAQWTTTHIFTVQRLDSALSISARHFDKAKATGTTRFTIVDQRNRLDSAVLFEQLADLSFVGRKRQVTHIDFRHNNYSLSEKASRAIVYKRVVTARPGSHKGSTR
jgi:hypothetical protein